MLILFSAALFSFGLLLFSVGLAVGLLGLVIRIVIWLFQLGLLLVWAGIATHYRPAAQPPAHPVSVVVTFRPRGAEIAASSNVNGRWRLRVMAPGS
jgi:hypothetical protein